MQHDLMAELVEDHQRELRRLAGRSARGSQAWAETPPAAAKDHQRELFRLVRSLVRGSRTHAWTNRPAEAER